MRVAVFGANGDSGREITRALVERGHSVVAAVRRLETVTPTAYVQVKQVNLQDADSVAAAIKGCDAVVSALGSGKLVAASKPTSVYSQATRAIRAAMREQNIKRLIVLSSGGVEYDGSCHWIYLCFLRRFIINTYVDMARMEGMLEETNDLEWTAVRLPYIHEGKSMPYLVMDRNHGPKCNFELHFPDVGNFVADELKERRWIQQFPAPSYAA